MEGHGYTLDLCFLRSDIGLPSFEKQTTKQKASTILDWIHISYDLNMLEKDYVKYNVMSWQQASTYITYYSVSY